MRALAGWQNKWMQIWSRLWLWSRLGVGAKMTLIIVIGMVLLVALFAYMGISALNQNIQQSLEARVVVAQTAARHVDHILLNIEHELTQAALQDGLSDPSRRNSALQSIYAHVDFFGRQLLLTSRQGKVVAAYPPIPGDPSIADARAVQLVLGGESFAVSRSAGEWGPSGTFPLAVTAVRDASGQVQGTLILSIDLTSPNLGVFNNPVGLGASGYMDLVDADGVILASTRPERPGQSSDHNTVLVNMIQARHPFVSRCHSCHVLAAPPEPQPEMLALAPVTRATWGVTIRQDENEVLATARNLQRQIFAFGALALLGALVLVYLTTQSVITPVQGLTAAAQRIAAGDLETSIDAHGEDEIGMLARAFDSMRSKLKNSIAEIQGWNRELDARVQERTAALAFAQNELKHSHDHLQAIIDSLSDEMIVIDLGRHVLRANTAAYRCHPDPETLIGKTCSEVTHAGTPCRSPDCECPISAVIQTGKPFRVTHTHMHGDKTHYIEVIASPLFDSSGQVNQIVELMRDVTEETQLRETILQRNRELSAVNAIARVVGQSLKLDECLSLALGEVRRITQMDVGSIFLVESDDGTLKLHACYGISEEGAEVTVRQALSDSACGGVLEIGEPMVVQNPARSSRIPRRDWLASLVHIPLIAKGNPVGTLCLGTRKTCDFDQEQVSLLNAIGHQIAVAVENARLYEELSRKEQLRGELLRRLISVQEEERKRIARELHDETIQTLTALLYTIDAGADKCAQAFQPFVTKMRHLSVSAIDGVHKIIFDLRPTMLDQLGLVAALRSYAETRLGDVGAYVEVTESGTVRRVPSALETALFRTVQEAISNIARHAGARHVRIAFHFGEEHIEIQVKDDGIGFDLAEVMAVRDPRSGLGLVSMYERMSAAGGEFSFTSAPRQGTSIRLRAPITGGHNGADSSSGRG